MEKNQIINEVNHIFKDVLDNDDIMINESTTAKDVEEWDSLNHIQLVVAIEKHFKIRFTTQEIQNWKNVGEMADCILQKRSN
ncbi:MAG TPA: acyl carrier protein [Flavipsychrobacter sp.]|nr:acyl carrier protein [Flavipsychrobacter sp.]